MEEGNWWKRVFMCVWYVHLCATCVCICVCLHLCVYTCYMYACEHVCMHVCVCMCMWYVVCLSSWTC